MVQGPLNARTVQRPLAIHAIRQSSPVKPSPAQPPASSRPIAGCQLVAPIQAHFNPQLNPSASAVQSTQQTASDPASAQPFSQALSLQGSPYSCNNTAQQLAAHDRRDHGIPATASARLRCARHSSLRSPDAFSRGPSGLQRGLLGWGKGQTDSQATQTDAPLGLPFPTLDSAQPYSVGLGRIDIQRQKARPRWSFRRRNSELRARRSALGRLSRLVDRRPAPSCSSPPGSDSLSGQRPLMAVVALRR